MTILGPDGRPVRSQTPQQEAAAVQLRGGTFPTGPAAYLDPGWRDGLPSAGDGGLLGRYGPGRAAVRQMCRALYFSNGLFQAAVDIAGAFLVGDAIRYGNFADPGLQAIFEDFWQRNSMEELVSGRLITEWFLDGEVAVVFPNGEDAVSLDQPAPIGLLDVDHGGFSLDADTSRGATAGDMVSRLNLRGPDNTVQRWDEGEFAWGAHNAMWNDPRGWSLAMGAADFAVAYLAMMNMRLNVHHVQQRVLAVYSALMDPLGVDQNGLPDGGAYGYSRKTMGFRRIPADGGVLSVMVKPGYSDAAGNRYDGVQENIEFLKPAQGAADAASDMKLILRMLGLTMGGLPEHYLGEGGGVTRTCYSADTETLTVEGWRHYQDITADTLIAQYNPETKQAEWVPAGPLHIAPYQGDMLHFKSSVVDILVTPDHRMYAQRARDRKALEAYEIIRAEDIQTNKWDFLNSTPFADSLETREFILPAVPTGTSRAIYPEVHIAMDTWLEFLGYWISEGSANLTSGGTFRVTVAQKKPEHVGKIRAVIQAMPEFDFVESTNPDGTIHWVVSDKGLCLWLMEHCGIGAKNMRLPELAKNLSQRQGTILFTALMDGDGSWERRRGFPSCGIYYSSSKQLVDDVQLLAMRMGHRANISDSSLEATGCYRVQLTMDRHESMITANKNIQRVAYDGLVYCYSVPSGLFITRRNGRIAIQGNTAEAMGLPSIRLANKRQAGFRANLTRVLRAEVKRRAGAGAKFRVQKGSRKRVSVDLIEFPFIFPEIREESLDQIIQRVQLGLDKGLISDETGTADLGYDPALEKERLAGQGPRPTPGDPTKPAGGKTA